MGNAAPTPERVCIPGNLQASVARHADVTATGILPALAGDQERYLYLLDYNLASLSRN